MKIKWKWRVFVLVAVVGYAGTFLAFMSLTNQKNRNNKLEKNPVYRNGTMVRRLQGPGKFGNTTALDHNTVSLLSKIQQKTKGQQNDWQEVTRNLLYVYAAYHDLRSNEIVVVGAVDSQRAAVSTRIALWREDKPDDPDTEQAMLSIHPDSHGNRYVTSFVKCALSNTDTPNYVSVYTRVTVGFEKRLYLTNNLLPVTKVKDNRPRDRDGFPKDFPKFSVCVSPLHGRASANEMVEFIEVNKLFGAEKFIFYNALNKNSSIVPYIDHYSKHNVAIYHKWSLPDVLVKSTHYFAQIAALNDCLLKVMFHTQYVAFLDLDEFIIPMRGRSWNDILSHPQVAKHNKTAGMYSFQNVFFKTEWPSDGMYKNHVMVNKYNVKTLLKTYRELKVFAHRDRSKMILIPERVKKVGGHFVHKYSAKNFKAVNIPYSLAMLFHYRDWEEPEKPIELLERKMHEFAGEIINRISNTHLAVKGIL